MQNSPTWLVRAATILKVVIHAETDSVDRSTHVGYVN